MKLYALKDSDGWTSIQLLREHDTAVKAAADLCDARAAIRHYTCQILEIDTETETMLPMEQLEAAVGSSTSQLR